MNMVEKEYTKDPNFTFVFITQRRSLASDIANRFSSYDITKYDSPTLSTPLSMVKRLVIQVDSLHKLSDSNGLLPAYDLVIIDEIRSLLAHTILSITVKRRLKVTKALETIILTGKRIMVCDAHIDGTCVDYFNATRGKPASDFILINNQFNFNDVSHYFKRPNGGLELMENVPCNYPACNGNCGSKHFKFDTYLPTLIKKIVKSVITKGRKTVFCSSSASSAEAIFNYVLSLKPEINGFLYTSAREYDIHAMFKKTALEDVNGINGWGTVDFLVYSPLISTGIDFTIPHFEKMFGLYTRGSCVAREFAQMLNRIRNMKTVNGKIKKIHIFIPDPPSNHLPTDKNTIQKDSNTLKEYISIMATEAYLMDIHTNDPADFLTLPITKTYLYNVFVDQILERNESENDPGTTLKGILEKHYQVSGNFKYPSKVIPIKRLLNEVVKETEENLLKEMEKVEGEKPGSIKSSNPSNKKRGLKDVYGIDNPNQKIFEGRLPLTTDKAVTSYETFKELYYHWESTLLNTKEKMDNDIIQNVTHPQVIKWIQTNIFETLNTTVVDPQVSKMDLVNFWYHMKGINFDDFMAVMHTYPTTHLSKIKNIPTYLKDHEYVEKIENDGIEAIYKKSLKMVNDILYITIGCKLAKNNDRSKRKRLEDDVNDKSLYIWGAQGSRFSSMAKHSLTIFSPYDSMDDLYKPL